MTRCFPVALVLAFSPRASCLQRLHRHCSLVRGKQPTKRVKEGKSGLMTTSYMCDKNDVAHNRAMTLCEYERIFFPLHIVVLINWTLMIVLAVDSTHHNSQQIAFTADVRLSLASSRWSFEHSDEDPLHREMHDRVIFER